MKIKMLWILGFIFVSVSASILEKTSSILSKVGIEPLPEGIHFNVSDINGTGLFKIGK